MNYFLCFVAFVLGLVIIVKQDSIRFLLFVIGLTFLPFGAKITPSIHAARILIYASWISILVHRKDLSTLKVIPFLKLFVLLFIAHLLTGIVDSRVGPVVGILKAINTFSETFGCLIIGYVFANKRRDLLHLDTVIRCLAYVISFYSIFSLFIGVDLFCNFLGGSDSLRDERMRVAGFFFDSHVAGMAISVYLLLLLFEDYCKHKKVYMDFCVLLLVVALLLTKSRSSLLDFCFGIFIMYFLLFLRSRSNSKYCSFLLYGFIFSIVAISAGDMIFSQFFDAFKEDGGNTGGSTIALRLQQLIYSWYLFLESPWFGNGFQYFWEVINSENGYLSSMLMGAEGYVFVLLIERGIIQILLIVYFFYQLFKFLIKNKRKYSILAIAILSAFLLNSIVTGNLYKWPFALPFVGFYMRLITKRGNNVLRRYTFI